MNADAPWTIDLSNADDSRVRFAENDATHEADRQWDMHAATGHEPGVLIHVLPGLVGTEDQHRAATDVLEEITRLKARGITHEQTLAGHAERLADIRQLPRADDNMRSRYTPDEASINKRLDKMSAASRRPGGR